MKLSIYVKHEERQLSLQIHIIHIVLILDYQLITLYKYIVDRYAQLMHNLHRTIVETGHTMEKYGIDVTYRYQQWTYALTVTYWHYR
jgi:hypothetical protein